MTVVDAVEDVDYTAYRDPLTGYRYVAPLTAADERGIAAKLLQEALDDCGWNKKQAALQLGISRSSLYEKIKKYQITKPTLH